MCQGGAGRKAVDIQLNAKALLGLLVGLLVPLCLPAMPTIGAVALLGLLALSLCWHLRWFAGLLLVAGSLWTLWHLQQRLNERIDPPAGTRLVVTGVVTGLPVNRGDQLEFRLRVIRSQLPNPNTNPLAIHGNDHPVRTPQLKSGSLLLVRWYRHSAIVQAGEVWRLSLKLKPARGRVNFQGQDSERYFLAQGLAGLATVDEHTRSVRLAASSSFWQGWRQQVAGRIANILEDHPARALILALSVADRSAMSDRQKQQFRDTGTSHMLAISGMHIGLAAVLGLWLSRALLLCAPSRLHLLHGQALVWAGALGLAALYAVLAGLAVPTQRALLMLATFCLLRLCGRSSPVWHGLTAALLLILVIDPLAPLSAGFWFSFVAVAVLWLLFSHSGDRGQSTGIKSLWRAQTGLVLVLMPLGMLWFQQASLLGLLANLLAIPWLSATVVPPILLALLALPVHEPSAVFLLLAAAESAHYLSQVLAWLAHAGHMLVWFTAEPKVPITLLACAGALAMLQLRFARQRLLALCLMLPLMLPAWLPWGRAAQPAPQELQLEMLDVGQGLAVLLSTASHTLLYDSGPGDGVEWSLVPSVIAPALATGAGSEPDQIVISHGDLDHAGGLHELLSRYPDTMVIDNLRPGSALDRVSGHQRLHCRKPLQWAADGVTYQVLHPGPGLPYLGNDSSCTLSVHSTDQSILLTGDISAAVEQRLVAEGLGAHDVLIVGHHGSKSSSSVLFLDTVQAQAGLVSAAWGNRFGFPHLPVVERFEQRVTPLWSTADCGAMRLLLRPGDAMQVQSARRQRPAVWRWPAAEDCP